jgi:hypothetical protein
VPTVLIAEYGFKLLALNVTVFADPWPAIGGQFANCKIENQADTPGGGGGGCKNVKINQLAGGFKLNSLKLRFYVTNS